VKAQRTHGTKLHIDDANNAVPTTPKEKEHGDFFNEVTTQESSKYPTMGSAMLFHEQTTEDKSTEFLFSGQLLYSVINVVILRELTSINCGIFSIFFFF
jgi:hypothetical protein